MKKRFWLKIISLIVVSGIFVGGLFVAINLKNKTIIIVNNLGGGRFGDQVIACAKTKWLSHKYNIPFRFIPFKGSEKIKISCEKKYTSLSYFVYRVFYKLFGKLIYIDSEDMLVQALRKLDKPTRFVAHINTRLNEHIAAHSGLDREDCAWVNSVLYELTIQDPVFGKKLKAMVQPMVPVEKEKLPKDRVTVAVHLRKGSAYDPQLCARQYYDSNRYNVAYKELGDLQDSLKSITTCDYTNIAQRNSADKIWLDKFPTEQYYVDQIKKLSDLLDNVPMYVYLFTDTKEPRAILERIKTHVDKSNITFACRKKQVRALQDLFAMTQFDCLIRAGSGFSYVAQLLGNHKIIMYPLHLTWHNPDYLIVDEVGIFVRKNLRDIKKT